MNDVDAFILDHLEHAGIKGMRWGVRKAVVKSGPGQATQRYAQRSLTSRRAAAGVKTGSAIRKGYQKFANAVDKHPIETGLIVAGATYVAARIMNGELQKIIVNQAGKRL